ncbi:tRNA (guanine-N(7)-)-methyltransferase [Clostridia bacterium]|nr:tRNA (guanine-N(7)-)-methyltransferase [Clostridia bacterium]
MRMRRKKNLVPRLEAVAPMILPDPAIYRGNWREHFKRDKIWVELGCGMGRFAAECASRHPDVQLLAVEKVPDALVVAAEKAAAVGLPNLILTGQDAALFDTWFERGEVDRLYIQFCDPWHKARQAKRRLTHRIFLDRYAKVLSQSGELIFKSDNRPLFDFTLQELPAAGWRLNAVSQDWHRDSGRPTDDIATEYELKFAAQNVPIGRVSAGIG